MPRLPPPAGPVSRPGGGDYITSPRLPRFGCRAAASTGSGAEGRAPAPRCRGPVGPGGASADAPQPQQRSYTISVPSFNTNSRRVGTAWHGLAQPSGSESCGKDFGSGTGVPRRNTGGAPYPKNSLDGMTTGCSGAREPARKGAEGCGTDPVARRVGSTP